MHDRKLVLYIAMSLDGFIAGENDDISWLSIVDDPPEDYGYIDFISSVDTVIMGRRTYDKVLGFGIGFPHRNKKCYVLSKQKTGKDENVEFYNGDIKELIQTIRQSEGGTIFCDGGSEIIFQLMKLDLIDRYIISILSVCIGGGIRLFKSGRPTLQLQLTRSSIFPSGLVQLRYERKQLQ
jgi:dihydrofolate reductase